MAETPQTDPDDAPELDEHFFSHAEIRDGEKVVRPATGTLTKKQKANRKADNG